MHTHTHTHTYIASNTRTHTHTHACTQTHTCMHTHTPTHTHKQKPSLEMEPFNELGLKQCHYLMTAQYLKTVMVYTKYVNQPLMMIYDAYTCMPYDSSF